ncbi:MAG: serine/threonine protein kinase, partial [Acidobacteriota bacterium]|nr:serine/threonine protein kinase [Acidobacteriota bacterium]
MDAARYQRLRALFDAAQSVAAAERQAFAEAQTPGDPSLRVELLSMLAASDDSIAFARPDLPPAHAAGTQIGAYKVLRELGRGGMGV